MIYLDLLIGFNAYKNYGEELFSMIAGFQKGGNKIKLWCEDWRI